jgi:DNA-binding NarL/FixJ family response regulator
MLTPQQRTVAELVARGYSNKKIAREVGISPETVRDHIRGAADRIPGDGRPRYKLLVFMLLEDEDAA